MPTQENEEGLTQSVDDALGVDEGAFDTADPVALGRAFTRAMQTRRDPAVVLGTGLGSLRSGARSGRRGFRGPVRRHQASRCRGDGPEGRTVPGTGVAGQSVLPRAARVVPAHRTAAPRAGARRAPRRPRRRRRRSSPRSCSPTRSRPPTSCSPTRPRWCARSRPRAAAWSAARATSCTTSSRTTAGRARSTASPFDAGREHRGHAGQGRVPQRADRGAPVRRRRPTRCSRSRCSCARRGSTATTSPTSRRGRAWSSGRCDHGHTTFAISYRNPDESMRDLTFDDYLRLGPLTAIDVARDDRGQRDGEHARDLPRRHDERDGARVPRRVRRPPRATPRRSSTPPSTTRAPASLARRVHRSRHASR